MRGGKIALWVFIAFLISGVMFGLSFLSDVSRAGGWDKMVFGIGTQYSVNDVKEMDLSGFRKIEITVSSSNTRVAFSNAQKVSAALTGEVRTTNPDAVPYLEMRASGDTLIIDVKRKATMMIGYFSSNIKLDVSIPAQFNGDLSYSGSSGNVVVPSGKLNSLNIETSSGNVSVGSVELAQDLIMHASSGNLDIESVKAANARVSCSSGNIKAGFFILSGEAFFETSSGRVTVEGVSAQNAVYHSSSGTLTVGASGTGKTTAETSSGRIDIRGIEGDAQVTATSGEITLKFIRPGSNIAASCSSGRIQLGLPSDAQFYLDARTGSGNIKSDFNLDGAVTDKKSIKGQVGDGRTQIALSTSSGSIQVSKN